jgi:transposase
MAHWDSLRQNETGRRGFLLTSVERTKSAGAVSQWLKRARETGGVEGLKRRPPPGMTPRLRAEQRAQVQALLTRGAAAYGFRGDVWTARRVAQLIADTFGVRYHRDHVSRLLRHKHAIIRACSRQYGYAA